MARRSAYLGALIAFLAASAMTLSSIAIPNWISYSITTSSGSLVQNTYGLHAACRNNHCEPFPTNEWCRAYDANRGSNGAGALPEEGSGFTFCSMWRTVGFLMSFSVVLYGMILVSLVVALAGGVQKRVKGRPVVCSLLLMVGAVELAAMAIVAYLFDTEDMFFPGWRLSTSWMLCTASWVVAVLASAALWFSVYVLPMEGGYELIADQERVA